MTSEQYRAFLDLLMCCDPWPVPDGGECHQLLLAFADSEARKRGFDNWTVAYRGRLRPAQATVGTRVRSLVDFAGVPAGTEGVIDEDYGIGVMVAWDLPGSPLPPGYRRHAGRPAIQSGILRDGFDKATELQFLKLVEGGG